VTLNFTVPIPPEGKARPRVQKNGIVYTPAKTKTYENFIKGCYVENYGDFSFKDTSIRIYVKAFMPIPTKFRKAEKEAALANVLKPIGKPDGDNILKAVLDALNQLAYDDDCYIYAISVIKEYSDMPRIEVTISDEPYTDLTFPCLFHLSF